VKEKVTGRENQIGMVMETGTKRKKTYFCFSFFYLTTKINIRQANETSPARTTIAPTKKPMTLIAISKDSFIYLPAKTFNKIKTKRQKKET